MGRSLPHEYRLSEIDFEFVFSPNRPLSNEMSAVIAVLERHRNRYDRHRCFYDPSIRLFGQDVNLGAAWDDNLGYFSPASLRANADFIPIAVFLSQPVEKPFAVVSLSGPIAGGEPTTSGVVTSFTSAAVPLINAALGRVMPFEWDFGTANYLFGQSVWEFRGGEPHGLNAIKECITRKSTSGTRERISDEVRTYVWRRDGGMCVKCGSQVRLEYDHIIPVSRGGSSTERNVQLLCEECNRRKSDSI